MTNTLYKVDFSINYDDSSKPLSCWNVKSIKHPDSSMKIKQIATNDKSVYVLDDHSGIFEMSDNVLGDKALILKWRLDKVEILKLCCGFGHFVVLSDTGALFSWGSGGRGELGHFVNDHVMVNCDQPKRIEFFDDLPTIVKDFFCGGWHTLALTSDGDIYSWGWNESGQLGYNSNSKVVIGGVPYPIDLGSGTDPVVQIACGARHSLAVLKNGKCFSWGLNKHGELGLNDFDNRSEPVEIKFNATDDDYDKKYNNIAKVECGRWCSFVYFS
jgi:alpha-tubulin suppressor-like RCC1 family protein